MGFRKPFVLSDVFNDGRACPNRLQGVIFWTTILVSKSPNVRRDIILFFPENSRDLQSSISRDQPLLGR